MASLRSVHLVVVRGDTDGPAAERLSTGGSVQAEEGGEEGEEQDWPQHW